MSIEQIIADISQLPPQEQIVLAQAIWNGLAEDASLEITPEQQAELNRRWAKYEADKSKAIPLDEFRDQVRSARKK
jgi:putative addiction module component (TIGR02574 family)